MDTYEPTAEDLAELDAWLDKVYRQDLEAIEREGEPDPSQGRAITWEDVLPERMAA